MGSSVHAGDGVPSHVDAQHGGNASVGSASTLVQLVGAMTTVDVVAAEVVVVDSEVVDGEVVDAGTVDVTGTAVVGAEAVSGVVPR